MRLEAVDGGVKNVQRVEKLHCAAWSDGDEADTVSTTLFFPFFLYLYISSPADFRKREEEVVKQLNEIKEQAEKVMELISTPEVVSALRQDKQHNLTYLKDSHNVRHYSSLSSSVLHSPSPSP
jgi:hypothetical protein